MLPAVERRSPRELGKAGASMGVADRQAQRIGKAVYSATGSPPDTSAASAAPRAWPSSSVLCGLTLTKTISAQAQSGV